MKICFYNGMDSDNTIENIVEDNLKNHDFKHLKLREMNVGYCRCCSGCSKTGRCIKNDDGIEAVERYKESDVLILLTDIRYGGYSKNIKKVIDRLLPIGCDELQVKEGYMIHKIVYNNKKVIVIGVLNEQSENQEMAFNLLIKANYINIDWKSYSSTILYKNQNEVELTRNIRSVLKEVIGNV